MNIYYILLKLIDFVSIIIAIFIALELHKLKEEWYSSIFIPKNQERRNE